MRKPLLAIAVLALGASVQAQQTQPLPTSRAGQSLPSVNDAAATAPLPPVARPPRPAVARPGYDMYGGPAGYSSDIARERESARRGNWPYEFLSPSKVPHPMDEIELDDRMRTARYEAAVKYGRYQNMFLGSTRFWVEEDLRKQGLAHVSMGALLWDSIHPPEESAESYMYNHAALINGTSAYSTPANVSGPNSR
jgi:hypothetical protein